MSIRWVASDSSESSEPRNGSPPPDPLRGRPACWISSIRAEARYMVFDRARWIVASVRVMAMPRTMSFQPLRTIPT
jgi:hypothetical protein